MENSEIEYSERIFLLTKEINIKKDELKQYILSNHTEYKLNHKNMIDLQRQICEIEDEELKKK